MVALEIFDKIVEIGERIFKPDNIKVLEQHVVAQLQDEPHTKCLVPHHVDEYCVQICLYRENTN
jgi:hypothetical protein